MCNRSDRDGRAAGTKCRFKRLYDLHTIQYAYDKLERLRAADYRPAANLSAAPFRQHSYAYDVAGNRTQVNDNGTITNYTYNAANQISNAGFGYDAAGRMTGDGVNTYTWDRADRLLSMAGVQNQYNGLGQRVQQSIGAQVTQYLLDTQPGLWQVLAATVGHDASYHVCLFVELRFLAECGCGVDVTAPRPRYVQPELPRSNASSGPESGLKRSDAFSDTRDHRVSLSIGTGLSMRRRSDPVIRSSGRKTSSTWSTGENASLSSSETFSRSTGSPVPMASWCGS